MSERPSTADEASVTPELGGTRSVVVDEQTAVEVNINGDLSHRERGAVPIISLAVDSGSIRIRARLTPAEAELIGEELAAVAASTETRAREANEQG
jgi:hypothetical protein